jgi:hypothetical protein
VLKSTRKRARKAQPLSLPLHCAARAGGCEESKITSLLTKEARALLSEERQIRLVRYLDEIMVVLTSLKVTTVSAAPKQNTAPPLPATQQDPLVSTEVPVERGLQAWSFNIQTTLCYPPQGPCDV